MVASSLPKKQPRRLVSFESVNVPYRGQRVELQDFGYFQKLDDVYASLTAFQARDKRLIFPELFREIALSQSCCLSLLLQESDKGFVPLSAECLCQEGPTIEDGVFSYICFPAILNSDNELAVYAQQRTRDSGRRTHGAAPALILCCRR